MKRSSKILNPIPDNCGARRRSISLRIIKKPLIGSLKVTPVTRRVTAVANRENKDTTARPVFDATFF